MDDTCLIRERDQTLPDFLTGLREQVSARTFGGHFFVAGGTLTLTACKSPFITVSSKPCT